MSINVKVGSSANAIEKTNHPSMNLNARKSIDGHIMIMDHKDIDIVVVPDKKKIITFPKTSMHDNVYSVQDRLFIFLANKGVIKRESIQSGDVYGSLQAEYPDAVNDVDATQMVVFTIGKFIAEEKPHMQQEEYQEEEFEKRLTNPDEEESTELGEVPQAAKKGSIDPSRVRRYLSGYGPY